MEFAGSTSVYILNDPATLRCGTVWLHGRGISVFPKFTVSSLFSVNISIGPQTTFTGARGAHKWHQGCNYSYHWDQNSSQLFLKPWFNTILLLFLYSPLQTLAHTIAKGSTFLISSPFDVTKLQQIVLMSHRLAAFRFQCRWTHILISLTTPIAMGTQLCFKQHRESHSSPLYGC